MILNQHRRGNKKLHSYGLLLVILSMLVLRIPILFEKNPIVFILVLSPYWLFIVLRWSLHYRKLYKKEGLILATMAALLCPFLISIIYLNDPLEYLLGKAFFFLTILLFIFSVVEYTLSTNALDLYRAIYNSIALFLVSNLFLEALGVEPLEGYNDTIGNSQTASLFSLEIKRRLLPLATGMNSMGILNACFMATNIILIINKIKSIPIFLMLLLSFYISLVVDTRMGFALTLLLIFIYLFFTSFLTYILKLIFPILIIAPILIVFIMVFDWGVLNLLKRPGELESVENFRREAIWSSGISLIADLNINTFIGYGYKGNVNGDLTAILRKVLRLNVKSPTVHNFILQMLIDMGVIGSSILFLFIYKTINYCSTLLRCLKSNIIIQILSISFIIILIGGITESIPTYYFVDIFILFIFILFIINYLYMKLEYT